MKTYSKTKTLAKTQLMRKVLKRLDNLRENRESVKQTSIRLGIPYYRKLTIHFINVEFYIQGTIINCKLDYYVHLPIKYFVVLCDLMVFDLIWFRGLRFRVGLHFQGGLWSSVLVLGVFVFDTTICITCNQPYITCNQPYLFAKQQHCNSLAGRCLLWNEQPSSLVWIAQNFFTAGFDSGKPKRF